jgi:hypothetical protein
MAWVCAAVVVAAGLSACSSPSTRNGDPAKVQQLAQADLARWEKAVSAAGGDSAFVAVGMTTLMVGYDWGPDPQVGYNDKVALMAGDLEAVVSLSSDTPPDGQVRWQDGSTQTVGVISAQQALADMTAGGSGPCKECVPLKVTGAQLTTGDFQTVHGQAVAPAWEFALEGTDVKIAQLAVAHLVKIVPPTFDPNGPSQPLLISIRSATGTAAGLTLTVTFEGAPKDAGGSCGADYTARAVESSTAVVVIVTEHPGFGLSLGCTAEVEFRTADATLSAPLGNRAVLEVAQGMPVSVTLTP